MPHFIAELIYLGIVARLYYQDHRNRPNCSRALWIPVIWLLLLGSRPLSFWLGIGGGGDDLEGNTFDRIFYVLMIGASWVVISRRGLNWGALFRGNRALVFFYLYLALTILWAAAPFVTFKRWFKEIGGMFVILVILTEQDPWEAMEAVWMRCAYVLLPLSVVFVKYIPEMGRRMSHDGFAEYIGVTLQKNALGEDVLVFGLAIVWAVLSRYDGGGWRRLVKTDLFWPLFILLMGLWLLHISDSKTALVCLVVGTVILTSNKLPIMKNYPRLTLAVFLGAIPLVLAINNLFDVMTPILQMLGRNPTLTHRTEIWSLVKDHPVDPIFGCGYLMYWDLNKVVQVGGYDVTLKTIHNGYLEIYLDGGYLGLAALFFVLLFVGIRVGRAFLSGSLFGRLQLAFFVAVLLYNLSESIYARRGPLWFSFLLLALDHDSVVVPRLAEDHEEESNDETEGEPSQAVNA